MKKITFILCIGMIACQSQDDKAKKKETPISHPTTENAPENPVVAEKASYDPQIGTKENIISAKNSSNTVRVDKMDDGRYRLLSWSSEQKPSDTPETIINDGKMTDEGSWGRAMQFDQDGLIYQLTDYSPAGDPTINLILKKGGNLQKSTILKSTK